MEMKNGSALSGLRVLDLGRVIAGPLASSMLADMGADVIKIEDPGTGDLARNMMPKKDGISTYFVMFNRGQRGVTLNLKSEEGKEILRKMILSADVLIENFRPSVMQRLGFSYEEVEKLNPRIIYASISGFGQEGVYANRPLLDPVAQAMSGLMSVTGPADGEQVRLRCSGRPERRHRDSGRAGVPPHIRPRAVHRRLADRFGNLRPRQHQPDLLYDRPRAP